MADKKISQPSSEDIDKLIEVIDRTYERMEKDLINALTEIRTLRWRIENLNNSRIRRDVKQIRKASAKLKKDTEETKTDTRPKIGEVTAEEINKLMEEVPEPPPDSVSMFPVPKDEKEDIPES